MFEQIYDPVQDSLGLSTIFAVLPLLTVFVLLGVLKMRAQWAALIALVVSLAVAVVIYGMPVGQALSAAGEGAAFGLFPIMWIVVNAIWLYTMTVSTGHFDVLRRSFGTVSDDQRIQAVIIAFCFGALLEALAGFGTPVAITAVMLIALGFSRMKAASVALVANTAPVAFGAIAVPITTLAKVTGLPEQDLASMVGRQTPILALFVPLALVYMVDGRRGVRQTWPAAVLGGFVFGVLQFVCANYISIALTDIVAALGGALAIVLLLRVWQPADVVRAEPLSENENAGTGADGNAGTGTGENAGTGTGAGGNAGTGTDGNAGTVASTDENAGGDEVRTARDRTTVSAGTVSASAGSVTGEGGSGRTVTRSGTVEREAPGEVARAFAPYLIIIAVFSLAQFGPIKTFLAKGTYVFSWPGLNIENPAGKEPAAVTFTFGWLPAAGTLLLLAGLLTMVVLRIAPARALRDYGRTLDQLKWAILTVAAVLALAYVMNLSGQTVTIGQWMAGAGGAFAVLSPILGWLGVAVTGSDTSSNALFGTLQVSAANGADLSPTLLAAANSSGGVLGKMISPQNLAIAAAAVGLHGKEGELLRKVLPWSLLFLVLMCALVYLQSTSVLSWMLP